MECWGHQKRPCNHVIQIRRVSSNTAYIRNLLHSVLLTHLSEPGLVIEDLSILDPKFFLKCVPS